MLERIVNKENMYAAFDRVVGNKGCAGVKSIDKIANRNCTKINWLI